MADSGASDRLPAHDGDCAVGAWVRTGRRFRPRPGRADRAAWPVRDPQHRTIADLDDRRYGPGASLRQELHLRLGAHARWRSDLAAPVASRGEGGQARALVRSGTIRTDRL